MTGADWELDFYSRPILESDGRKRWELLVTASPDGAAGDDVWGIKTADEIPAQPDGTVVRWRITATGATGAMSLPRDDDTVTYDGTAVLDADSSALPAASGVRSPSAVATAVQPWTGQRIAAEG